MEHYDEKLETIRFATYDSFRVLKGTDNYLEKYLPFLIQNLISQNFGSILMAPPKNQMDPKTGKITLVAGRDTWTAEEKKNYERYEAFKKNEYEIYKEFHNKVLNDDGNPKLKKTGFRMPGYRTVLGKKLNEYEIDNDILLKRRQSDLVSELNEMAHLVPEEVMQSDQSFRDDDGTSEYT